MKIRLTLLLVVFSLVARPQDTIKVLNYNLLNYGNYTSYCTSANNNHENKDILLRTIIGFELPDIFTVNEISRYAFYHDRVLDMVMNADGRNYYQRASIPNLAGSDLVNMLYFNTNKMSLKSHRVVQSDVRDIDLFTLYFKTNSLQSGDTVFLNCLVAHLKAGNTSADAIKRAEMTANAINFLKNNQLAGNYLFMGDLNTYTSTENCYQNLTGISALEFRFFDPVNKPGDWNNNSAFADWHTQSVSASGNGCQASGGMDDRFDHILATAEIMNGSRGLKYIVDSYHAVGQDGLHFNKSINDLPQNNLVPTDVLNALASNSDHLPVRLDLLLDANGPGNIAKQTVFGNVGVCISDQSQALLFVTSAVAKNATISLISITGLTIRTEDHTLAAGRNEIKMDISELKPGVYIIRLSDLQGQMSSVKLVK